MQSLKLAGSSGTQVESREYKPGLPQNLEGIVDICREIGTPEIVAEAERLYNTYKMFAINIKEAQASELGIHLAKNVVPIIYKRAVAPVRREATTIARMSKKIDQTKLEMHDKVSEQVAWVGQRLPEILKDNSNLSRGELARILRDMWNEDAAPKDKWSTKTASRRLARAQSGPA